MVNALIPRKPPLDRPPARFGQWSALVALTALAGLAMLAGCAPGDQRPGGGLPTDPAFAGAVVADEPHAVLAAREVLAAGGSAADAAAALTFALAVTYPSAAGLGGGGQCLVYARGEDEDGIASLDFLPGRQTPPVGGGRAIAVPGTVRGMDALQARYGRLRWSQTLVAAERLAGLGHPASRALVRDLAAGAEALFRDPAARFLFGARGGGPIAEGRTIVQPDLAALLERLRLAGGAEFYSGHTARLLEDAVARAGGVLDAAALERYRPRWRGTVSVPFGDEELHTVPGAGGAVAAAIWALAGADGRYGEAGAAGRARLLADAVLRGFASPPASAEGALDPASLAPGTGGEGGDEATTAGGARPGLGAVPTTSFAVVDRRGMAVACGLTMNGLFGAGKIAPGTGIVLAAAPEPDSAPTACAGRAGQPQQPAGLSGGRCRRRRGGPERARDRAARTARRRAAARRGAGGAPAASWRGARWADRRARARRRCPVSLGEAGPSGRGGRGDRPGQRDPLPGRPAPRA